MLMLPEMIKIQEEHSVDAGEMAYWIKFLPCKNKDLNKSPKHPCKTVCLCMQTIPVAGRQKQVDPWSSLPSWPS